MNLLKKKNLLKIGLSVLFFFGLFSCNDMEYSLEDNGSLSVKSSTETLSDLSIYIPNELSNNDFNNRNSQWYYGRSRQSEHFIVFWDTEYGSNDPNSSNIANAYRVDIDDLLAKAEGFYDMNINILRFAETGVGSSNLDKYKIMIFVYYQSEWLATGSGYDNVIGALWVSPGTCHPVGSTIAHEIGHSFQYQVYCDLGGGSGFRYGFGGNGGNAFWEQTAQWQSLQSYPGHIFTSYDFPVYIENYHRHAIHEDYRYASYFIHYYWADKHGRDFIGRLWREASNPEDPFEAYMRITNISVEALNDEMYDAAAKFVTWDLDAIRDYGRNYIGAQKYDLKSLGNSSYRVAYGKCPGTTGYNVIPLNVPAAGTVVSTEFAGLPNEPGYNTVDASRAGWRYGYVALLNDDSRVYGDAHNESNGTASFTVPENCRKLWLVVTGAPNTYKPHAWDDNESNDDQWPYRVSFTNTNLFGVVDPTGPPSDINFTYNLSFPVDAYTYSGTTVSMDGDVTRLATAFVLQSSEITNALGNSIRFYAVESDNTLNSNTTANGYGHWFDENGYVIPWSSNAKVFSEFNESGFSFSIGQYPGHCQSGDTYTIKQALVYEYETGKTVQATFIFNITII
jgi:hypothetical protein